MVRGWSKWELFVLSVQFFCKPETALKIKVYKHKNKQLKSTNIKINTHISAPQLKKKKKKSTDEEGENKEGTLIASPGHSVALLVLISALPVYFTYYS